MGKFNAIEDINVWKESIEMLKTVYGLMNRNNKFRHDYCLRDQIQRSAISIPSNIAEGYERESNQEFGRFLYIAKGSCGELRTQLYIALQLNYINNEDYFNIANNCRKISGMIMNLIKSLKLKSLKLLKH